MSPMAESKAISRFLFVAAGAKLVLPPAGEIPQLKPVTNRPKQPIPNQTVTVPSASAAGRYRGVGLLISDTF